MVTQLFLVQSFKVRVLVDQQKKPLNIERFFLFKTLNNLNQGSSRKVVITIFTIPLELLRLILYFAKQSKYKVQNTSYKKQT
jgi:hypothetical protein